MPVPEDAVSSAEPAAQEDVEVRKHNRRARRREQSREEILAATRALILRGGIPAATLDAVAREIGVSKAALYHYYPSKDALLFELIFDALQGHAHAVQEGVDCAEDGGAALSTIIRETVAGFAPRLDDFRLAFLYGQIAQRGAVHFDKEQFARIRPLNGLILGGATEKLAEQGPGAADVEPQLLAFLAYLSALGLLTMKGMVENLGDPLIYTDAQLIEGFAQVFATAARKEPSTD